MVRHRLQASSELAEVNPEEVATIVATLDELDQREADRKAGIEESVARIEDMKQSVPGFEQRSRAARTIHAKQESKKLQEARSKKQGARTEVRIKKARKNKKKKSRLMREREANARRQRATVNCHTR